MSTYLVLASSSTRNNMIRLDLENFATDLYNLMTLSNI